MDFEIDELYDMRWEFRTESKYMFQESNGASSRVRNEPHNPKGYILSGRIHTIRGDYTSAIDIYEKGVSLIASDDPRHALLTERKDRLKYYMEHCVDIVSLCPYDVFRTIVRHLTHRDLQDCIDVCRTWRYRILEEPTVWRRISIGYEQRRTCFRVMPMVCHHIKELVTDVGPSQNEAQCLEFIEMYDFSNIKSFSERDQDRFLLSGNHKEVKDSYERIERVYRALENIGGRLSYLELNMKRAGFQKVTVSLDRILSVCEHLKVFRCSGNYIPLKLSTTCLTKTTFLTRLELIMAAIDVSTIESVLRCSPLIEELIVSDCEEDFTHLLERYCPRLNLLAINIDGWNHSLNTPRKNGVYGKLHYAHFRSISVSRHLFSLLQKNDEALETVEVGYLNGTEVNWQQLSTFIAPNLKHLTLYLFCEPVRFYAVDILRLHPNVQNLELYNLDDEGMNWEPTDTSSIGSMLTAVASMRNLSELLLSNFFVPKEKQCVDQLFEHFAAQGQDAPLKRLTLMHCNYSSLRVHFDLSLITKIFSLTHLALLGEDYGSLSEPDIVDLARNIGLMPKLSVFAVHVSKFSVDAARYIVSCISLRHIYVETSTDWTSRLLEDVIDDDTKDFLTSHNIKVAKIGYGCYYFDTF